MLSSEDKARIAAFWDSFLRSPLYDTGFADAVAGCGANRTDHYGDTDREFAISHAYMLGYANACRIANDHMSVKWQIANLVGIAAGMFLNLNSKDSESNLKPFARTIVQSKCDTYTLELQNLLTHI